MNKLNSTDSANESIGDSTETARKAVEDYQTAITRFDVRSTIGDVHRTAARHGWDTVKLLDDVWHELWDAGFEPWNAQPVFVGPASH